MITFTKEQLIASAHARIEFAEMMLAGELEPLKERTWSIELELARIALASLEAEPVAWLLSGGGAKNNVSFDSGNAYADPLREVTPLYTAPPAPVSDSLLSELLGIAKRAADEADECAHAEFSDDSMKHSAAIVDWERRAAMLQGAEPVTTAYKLPELRYLDTVKFNADCALQDPESIYAQEFFMSLDEVFGERGNYTEPVQAKAVSILIAEIFRLRGYPAAPQQEVK